MEKCIFCETSFPCKYQLISEEPKNWLFVHDVKPQTDYHCLVVLKKEVFEREKIDHVGSIGDKKLPCSVLAELGRVLNLACRSIQDSCSDIEKVIVVSLNIGKGSEHLHFHLIPKRFDEKVRTVHNPCLKGGGLFFLARKEIVVDTFEDYIDSTCGQENDKIKSEIKKAVCQKVTANVKLLRGNFKWRAKGRITTSCTWFLPR